MKYNTLHRWVERQLGKPQECNKCGAMEEQIYHWSNISGNYKEDISDWQRLCVSCHKRYGLERLGGQNKHKILKTHCTRGHEFSKSDTLWKIDRRFKWVVDRNKNRVRVCRECQREYNKNYAISHRMEKQNG